MIHIRNHKLMPQAQTNELFRLVWNVLDAQTGTEAALANWQLGNFITRHPLEVLDLLDRGNTSCEVREYDNGVPYHASLTVREMFHAPIKVE